MAGTERVMALIEAGRRDDAASLVQQLAADGDVACIRLMGEMRWGGIFAPDPRAARALFEQADGLGDAVARRHLTNLLASGIAGPHDWPRALDRLRDEAADDPARARTLALIAAMALDADGDPSSLPVGRLLSAAPAVSLFEGLLSADECSYLRDAAEPLFGPSVVHDAQRRAVRDPIRTSDGATLHWLIEDPAVHALNRRLAAATESAPDRGEALQVLRYRPGQEYRPHFDFARAGDNQRAATALVWLNEDYEGGATCFTETGLEVKGRTGDCLVFRNMRDDRTRDPLSRHAGLPVTAGVKHLASRWIHERRFQP